MLLEVSRRIVVVNEGDNIVLCDVGAYGKVLSCGVGLANNGAQYFNSRLSCVLSLSLGLVSLSQSSVRHLSQHVCMHVCRESC